MVAAVTVSQTPTMVEGSFFASTFAFILGIYAIIISLVEWNKGCENDLASILLATGIIVLITWFLERLLVYSTTFDRAFLVLLNVILAIACFVLGGIVLGIYTFTIDPTNHSCNNLLYWSSFIISIILIASSLFIFPLVLYPRYYSLNAPGQQRGIV